MVQLSVRNVPDFFISTAGRAENADDIVLLIAA